MEKTVQECVEQIVKVLTDNNILPKEPEASIFYK